MTLIERLLALLPTLEKYINDTTSWPPGTNIQLHDWANQEWTNAKQDLESLVGPNIDDKYLEHLTIPDRDFVRSETAWNAAIEALLARFENTPPCV